MKMHTRIFLLGFMGSGKTYWARRLARAMELPLIEMDEQIVRERGMTIPEIFQNYGEPYFRQLEHDFLMETLQKDAFVLSTGGGLPCQGDHMARMNESGLTVWLDAPHEVLLERLKRGRERRPLLKDLDDEALAAFIRERVRARSPYYAQARLTVDPSLETVESFTNKIKSCKNLF